MSVVRHVPLTALADGALSRRLQAVVEAWSQRWFRRPVSIKVEMWGPGRPPSAPAQDDRPVLGVRDQAGLAAFGFGRRSLDALCECVLGSPIERTQANQHDLVLLDHLVTEAIAALNADFSKNFASIPLLELRKGDEGFTASSAQVGFLLSWSTPGIFNSVVRLWGFLDAVLAAEMRLALVQPGQVADDNGTDLAAADLITSIQDEKIEMGALVGRAWLPATELEQLRVGDVLILDKPTQRLLELTINNRIVTDWACEPVVEADSSAKLRLRTPHSGVSH